MPADQKLLSNNPKKKLAFLVWTFPLQKVKFVPPSNI
jgi:hypothetical protein